MTGRLYICPTPIGNLDDVTIRTLKVLENVDYILAEDTRRSIKLLNYYEIKNKLYSYHDHNAFKVIDKIIDDLKCGKNIAQVSDAGMPGISDPGEYLIKKSIENDIRVEVLPGPTASITSLVISGLKTDKFVFEGFLSSKRNKRIAELESLKTENRTMIFYESPYRVKGTLKDMLEILGNRKISYVRELTKKHEEVLRGNIEDILLKIKDKKILGEIVIVVEGCTKIEKDQSENINIKEELKKYMEKGLSKSKSVKELSKKHNISKNKVYQESLKL